VSDAFSVDLDQLDNIVSRLSGVAEFITDHLTILDQKVAAAHAGSWSGPTADAHRTAHSEWSSAAQEFVQGVVDMGAAARNAHTQYTSAVTANGTMLGRR
jgi:WXG100 family type VII secretion target